MKITSLIVVVSLFGTSQGWCSVDCTAPGRLHSIARTKRDFSATTELAMAATGREPAGVEQVFTTVKRLRLDQLARKVKPGGKLIWFVDGRRRRRRKCVAGELADQQEDDWKMKEHVALPRGWEFSGAKEFDALVKMKVILQNDFQELAKQVVCLPDGQAINPLESFPDVYGDIRLLRFLRKDREKDPVSAALTYRKFLKWRRKNNVDEVRARVDARPFQVPPELAFVSELLPCDFDVGESSDEDENTRFAITLHLGQWQTSVLSRKIRNQEVALSDFLVYWIYIFESVHKRLNDESVRRQKMVFIDGIGHLKGFSLQQLSPAFVSSVLRPWIKQLQSNYPETAKRIDVIDPPHVVSLIWRIVVPLLSPGTVAKIRIH